MKFQRYLDEEKFYSHTQKTVDQLASFLDKNCKPWFKDVGDYSEAVNPVLRGIKQNITTYTVKKGTRHKDREPKLTAKPVFEVYDKAFAEEFGWWVRSKGVFTGSVNVAYPYGSPSMFFPVGNYKYVWSFRYTKVWHNLTTPGTWDNMSDDQRELHLDDQEQNAKEAAALYNDKNIKRAVITLGADYEAIFQCKHYVLAEDDLADLALRQMFG